MHDFFDQFDELLNYAELCEEQFKLFTTGILILRILFRGTTYPGRTISNLQLL